MKVKADQTIKSGIEEINNKIEDRTTFFYYAFRNILLVGLPLLAISGFVLSLSRSSATDSSSNSDSLAITISSSCTLSSVVNTPHVTEVYNGHYKDNIGKTTIKTLCNDGNGYAIYANGYSDNEEGNNKLINSGYPQYSIDTGSATSGLTSTWAMKLNNIENDPSPTPPVIEQDYNNTYGYVPNYWTKVASRPSGTTDMDEGSSFTTTYSVYASSNQHAGTYAGQVKYLLTHPSAAEPNTTYYIMQEVANWKDDLDEDESVQAIDTRDGKIYWVTKLKDGHIWMTQNLDTDINSSIEFSSLNTDLNVIHNNGQYAEYSSGYTQVGDVIYWEPASTATTINFTGTTVTGWQSSNTEPYSASKTDDTNTGHASLGNYYNWTAAIASNDSSILTSNTLNDVSQNPQNSICPKGWRLPTISSQSGTIAGSTNEFARLNYLYNNNSNSNDAGMIAKPLHFLRGGNVNPSNSTFNFMGKYGAYWSNTIKDNSNSYFMDLGNTEFMRPSSTLLKSFGFSVRCLAR